MSSWPDDAMKKQTNQPEKILVFCDGCANYELLVNIRTTMFGVRISNEHKCITGYKQTPIKKEPIFDGDCLQLNKNNDCDRFCHI